MRLERTFIALDHMNAEDVFALLKEWGPSLGAVKVGMELFYGAGPGIMAKIRNFFPGKIFLDLKLHDIPQTVALSIKALSPLAPDYLTLHLAGGRAMIEAAREMVDRERMPTKLLGVALLTSLDPKSFHEATGVAEDQFLSIFDSMRILAESAGTHGMILSPLELPRLTDSKLIKVCPGIQFSQIESPDQKRVATPQMAFAAGADYIVIGRAWRNSPDRSTRLKELIIAEKQSPK